MAVTAPGLHTQVRITRDEFEAAARARIADTLGALDRAVAGAGPELSALAGVLLVGGTSRIPVVSEEVGRHTGRPTLLDADLKLVVALGAVGGSTVMATTKNTDAIDTNDGETANCGIARVEGPDHRRRASRGQGVRAARGRDHEGPEEGSEGRRVHQHRPRRRPRRRGCRRSSRRIRRDTSARRRR